MPIRKSIGESFSNTLTKHTMMTTVVKGKILRMMWHSVVHTSLHDKPTGQLPRSRQLPFLHQIHQEADSRSLS